MGDKLKSESVQNSDVYCNDKRQTFVNKAPVELAVSELEKPSEQPRIKLDVKYTCDTIIPFPMLRDFLYSF